MQDPDPFADPGFLDRLGKLLPMLGSGQAHEADTARRKLLEHLQQHRLSLTDVATRLRAPPPSPSPKPTRGMGEAELRRELELVRHARQAAEQMARSTQYQNSLLLQRTTLAESAAAAATVQTRGLRIATGAATVLAAGLLAIVVLDHMSDTPAPKAPVTMPATMQPSRPPLKPAAADSSGTGMAEGERLGTVLSNDIAVRADPAPDSHIRGFLPRGTEVIVVRPVDASGLQWVLVRSSLGVGFVPAASLAIR